MQKKLLEFYREVGLELLENLPKNGTINLLTLDYSSKNISKSKNL